MSHSLPINQLAQKQGYRRASAALRGMVVLFALALPEPTAGAAGLSLSLATARQPANAPDIRRSIPAYWPGRSTAKRYSAGRPSKPAGKRVPADTAAGDDDGSLRKWGLRRWRRGP